MKKRQARSVFCHSGFVIVSRFEIRISDFSDHARTGTEAVRSNFPHPTNAPFTARKIAFQIT